MFICLFVVVVVVVAAEVLAVDVSLIRPGDGDLEDEAEFESSSPKKNFGAGLLDELVVVVVNGLVNKFVDAADNK